MSSMAGQDAGDAATRPEAGRAEETAAAWTPDPGPWRRADLLAVLAWSAAVALAFRDAVSLQGALFYFDITEINYPYRDFVAEEFRAGRFSRWMPGLYNGLPLFSESQAGYLHPSKLLYLALPTWKAFNLDTILSVWLAGLATFGWLRRHVNPAGALAGAALLGFGGYTWAHLIHTSMINALVGVPLAIWALEWAWSGGGRRAVALGGLALAAQVCAGHLQDALMTILLVGLYALYRAAVEPGARNRLRALAPAAGLVALGVAVSAVQWVPSKELIDRSPRAGGLSFDDATFGSWHPELLPTLLVREAYGTRARDTDWMDGFYPYHEMNSFLGILALALAVVGGAAYRDRWVGFWVVLAGIAALLMLGRYSVAWDVLYRVPVLGSGRIPVRYHIWLTAAVAALAAVGVDRLARPGPVRVRLRWAVGLILVLAVVSVPILVYVYTPVWTQPDRWTTRYHQQRYDWLGQELALATLRTLALGLAGWVLAARLARSPDARRRSRLAWALPVLVLAELIGAHWHDAPTIDPSYWTTPPATARRLQDDPTTIRIFGLGDRSAGEPGYASEPIDFFRARDTLAWSLAPVFGLRSSGGLTPIISQRLVDYDEAANRAGVRFSLEGVSHVLVGRRAPEPVFGQEPLAVGTALIYPNPGALPRARLLGRPVYPPDQAEAVAALQRLGPDALSRVVVEDPARPLPPDAEARGTATIVLDLPERVVVDVAAETPAYLVLTDTFDPGWSASLDGQSVPIHPAYITFRTVFVPEGRHRVVFTYRPAGFTMGLAISLAGLAAVAVGLAWPGRGRPLGMLNGPSPWPRTWPAWFALGLGALVLASALEIGPAGRPQISDHWRSGFHRFTWGAGIEAMRPRADTPQ